MAHKGQKSSFLARWSRPGEKIWLYTVAMRNFIPPTVLAAHRRAVTAVALPWQPAIRMPIYAA
jgi:hypothetical protein